MKIRSLADINSVNSYLKRIGAEPRSMRKAAVREMSGKYWRDVAIISITPEGKVVAPPEYAPSELEKAAIEAECATVSWPKMKLLPRMIDLPEEFRNVPEKDVFQFKDLDGKIIMVQVRIERKGERSYIPLTYWDDDEWRRMEPEGNLPLWGLDQLKDQSTVFIHEGAKAARAMRWMVEGETPEARAACAAHPWGEEMKAAAHVGWIGGALSPGRTDWSALKKAGVKRAYIVSDNDAPGVAAVPSIAFHLRIPTMHVQFSTEWPGGFDLADEFPASMFKVIEGQRFYVGPSFRSCLYPATWATDQVPNPKGKPTTILRDNFKDMWAYVEESDLFVCSEMPEIIRSEPVLNKMLASFSHTNSTCSLIVKAYTGNSVRMCYRPDIKGRKVNDGSNSAINLHTPTSIKSRAGSIKPFIDFMTYMFPNESERYEVMRWCATLIARTDIHMEYGLLLVSEQQGVGKTTLGSSILAPLVGASNVSYPTEGIIVQSEFNGWLANKRLCIVNEIYSGHSWKAYNKLKSAITDRTVEVNEKFQRTYTVENWCHMFACSNSLRALKVEESDRRWFYPEVTEDKWPRERFDSFHNWLQSGGPSVIRYWAENFKDYVTAGQPAPMTERKKELIISSRSEGQQEAAELAEAMNCREDPVALGMKDIASWVNENNSRRNSFDTDLDLRKVMKECGVIWTDDRLKVNDRLQLVGMNRAAFDQLKEKFGLKLIRQEAILGRQTDESTDKLKLRKADFFNEVRSMVKSADEVLRRAM